MLLHKLNKTLFFCFFFIIYFCSTSIAQLDVQTGLSKEELVEILAGPGVLISNIEYSGAEIAAGWFTNGNSTNLELDEGIILSSGCATNTIGPNTQAGASCTNGTPGDSDLDALISPDNTKDACVLEFDFVPALDTIRVHYVFGSDEYPEFVGSYNDVFAFFISGPKPSGGTYNNRNIAIVPFTLATPVSIDNINNGTGNSGPCVSCEYYIDNTGGATIEYDGFTTVLKAWALVTPCETYHMKFAVADAVDRMLDTGVFLEGNSFMSVGTAITPIATTPAGNDFAVEGCLDIKIALTLSEISPTPTEIEFESIGGTAINGVDYTFLPLTHTIPANQLTDTIYIEAFIDETTEGDETIIVSHKEVDCVTNTYTILIKDLEVVEATLPSGGSSICGNSVDELSATIGFEAYLWNTNEITRKITVSPGDYWVEATDTYGCKSNATISILAKPVPAANPIRHH